MFLCCKTIEQMPKSFPKLDSTLIVMLLSRWPGFNSNTSTSIIRLLIMRTKGSICRFVQRLWDLLQQSSSSTRAIIWSPSGTSFIVNDQQQLAEVMLPKYFRHSNYSSFIRQLNMYNFHKIKSGNRENQYAHQLFKREFKQLLRGIKRKPTQSDIQAGQQLIKNVHKNQPGVGDRVLDDQEGYNSEDNHPKIQNEGNLARDALGLDSNDLERENTSLKTRNAELQNEVARAKQNVLNCISKVQMICYGFYNFQINLQSRIFQAENFLNHLGSEQPPMSNMEDYLVFFKVPDATLSQELGGWTVSRVWGSVPHQRLL